MNVRRRERLCQVKIPKCRGLMSRKWVEDDEGANARSTVRLKEDE